MGRVLVSLMTVAVVGVGLPMADCHAAEVVVRSATATGSAVAASLKAAQAERDRLLQWQKDALPFLPAEAVRVGNVQAFRTALQRLVPRLIEADSIPWTTARSALAVGELDRMLAAWVGALGASVQSGVMEAGEARNLQDLLTQARRETANFELAAPARPSQADWDGHRDRLFAGVRAQDSALEAVEAASNEVQRSLRARALSADTQIARLQRMVALLQPPRPAASAVTKSP